MGMLKSISLENYKCFKKLDNLEIAPLTVLCGVNSSGKSSILKSLLMLKQSYENSLSTNELTFNGKYVDNGFFEDVVYNRKGNIFTIRNSFEIIKPPKTNTRGITESDATSYNELLKIFKKYARESYSKIECFRFDISIDVYGLINQTDISKKIKNVILNYDITIIPLKKDSVNYKQITDKKIKIILKRTPNKDNNYFGRKYDVTINNIPYEIGSETKIFDGTIDDCSCYFEGVKLVKLYKTNSKIPNLNMIFPNIYSIFRIVSYQYKNIKHISPLRNSPSRRYIFDENVNSTGIGGEFTAQALYYYNEKPVVFINPPQNDRLELNNFTTKDLMGATRIWANYLGIGEINVKPHEEMLKINISNDNIADVGFGISQGLPVLVSGLLLNKHETLLLEQPEIHLHPNMQMKMADFLLTQACNHKNIIVETHSDHIINRITRRVMEDKTGILQKLIKIYYVQGYNSECPIYKDIKFDSVDGLVNAPDDFFTQFGSELMHITKAGMMNSKEGIVWQK